MRVTYFKVKPENDSPVKQNPFNSPTKVTVRDEATKDVNNIILDLEIIVKQLSSSSVILSVQKIHQISDSSQMVKKG